MELVLTPGRPTALSTDGLFPGAPGLSCTAKPAFYLAGRPGPCLSPHLWVGLGHMMEGEHPGDF